MKYFITSLIPVFIITSLYGQKTDFLPLKNYWHVQSLDPIESQSFAMVAAYWENGSQTDFILTGFSFGFQKAFFAWHKSEDRGYDLGIEGAAITQFEWTDRTGSFQRNILSTDFRVGVPFVMYFKPWTIRVRYYHLSAHMGDDYMIRNKITSYHNNNNNYEQLDITASYLLKDFRFYFCVGSVLRASQAKKPLVITGGLDYLVSLNAKESTKFYMGFYADTKQDHGFTPAINVGTGVQLGKPDRRPIKILVTYFYGPLPYSVYEGRSVQWLGVGIYINPF